MRGLLARLRKPIDDFEAEFGVTLNYQLNDVLLRGFAVIVIAIDVVAIAAVRS